MKTPLLLIATVLFGTAVASAATLLAGPKGGRLFDTEPHKTEFFVNADRKVEITFYDAALKPVAPADHVVSVFAEPAAGKTAVELTKTAAGFVSTAPLPAGEPYRVVVQVRDHPGAKPHNFRLDFNSAECAECKHAEYACTCEGH